MIKTAWILACPLFTLSFETLRLLCGHSPSQLRVALLGLRGVTVVMEYIAFPHLPCLRTLTADCSAVMRAGPTDDLHSPRGDGAKFGKP